METGRVAAIPTNLQKVSVSDALIANTARPQNGRRMRPLAVDLTRYILEAQVAHSRYREKGTCIPTDMHAQRCGT